jgi:hypothetical protein
MTTPPPSSRCGLAIDAIVEEQGPLVRQPANAARLATILHHGATELWDLCTYTDAEQIKTEARAIANRIKAACMTR